MRAIACFLPVFLVPLLGSKATAQIVQISPLQTNLQVAVCENNWNQALRAIAPLIGSPGITDAYRLDLIHFRMHLEDWRAANASFINLPGCEGVIPVSPVLTPTSSRPLNWQRAVESVGAP